MLLEFTSRQEIQGINSCGVGHKRSENLRYEVEGFGRTEQLLMPRVDRQLSCTSHTEILAL